MPIRATCSTLRPNASATRANTSPGDRTTLSSAARGYANELVAGDGACRRLRHRTDRFARRCTNGGADRPTDDHGEAWLDIEYRETITAIERSAARRAAAEQRTIDALVTGNTTNRRGFLQHAFGAAAVTAGSGMLDALLGSTAAAQTAALEETVLRDGLSVIGGAGGNVVLLRSAAGMAVVDSGASEFAGAVAAAVRDRGTDGKIRALFNTHWHPEHTGGNDALAPLATEVIAHENTRLWMSTEYYVDWQDRTYTPRAAGALPNKTFYASDPQPLALTVGDERIEYGHLREAHTDGDMYVLFRERNVLVAGGAVSVGRYPVIDYATGGWIGGLLDATEKLLDLSNDRTLIVPDSGRAQPRTHLVAQHEMLTAVRERVANLMRKGRSIDEMLAAGVTDDFDSAWGDNRARFVANIYHGLWWAGRLDGSL